MAIEHADVLRAAHLARLGLNNEAEAAGYVGDLTRILEMVDRLQAVDTDGVVPLSHPLDATQRLRPDEVTETNQRDTFQACAPETAGGLYLVPRVVE
ncbi:Asp-tRNA(Asn)/Glu-tRNA(Gln) amidotransferase subunit GatC [Salinicola halophyticus]|uniref:Asp-tRNA(Asn)/Glu-tRNA(Gln) amidotransferase subunit GatC n=1 Tax=Salinicola halophyticus TaxID=1808881 RepID=UPI000DA10B85|nr:Asp-tRNA(Asn)/Glu-tRNA(Gln) amidotransferase subunit GatC [Salinicola halophyticus]